jgi:nitronate monooxygenase
MQNTFTERLNIKLPIVGGAMYPCSNPELVAAVSQAGGIGIVQPLALTYVWGYSFKEGIRTIKNLTSRPIGMNVLLEKTSRIYEKVTREWVDIALDEGVRFFVTALGNPRDICKEVQALGGIVFHDVTNRKWALKGIDSGIDGLICVNNRAGGHAGTRSPVALFEELSDLGLPLICAGGIGDERDFAEAMSLGYSGVQIGTRFIATRECSAHDDYKQAIVKSRQENIVLTERVTGIPLSVIETPHVKRVGTRASLLAKALLRHRRTKEWMRVYYNLGALMAMKRSVSKGFSTRDYWQAGKSVEHIHQIESVADIMQRFAQAWDRSEVPMPIL